MKYLVLTISLMGMMVLSGNLLTPHAAADSSRKEGAIVEFVNMVKVGNVLLKGQYWIVHDEDKMEQGEACTYIYTIRNGAPDRLKTSFHCTPVERKKVDRFTISSVRVRFSDMLSEVKEIQFAGSSVGHQVPN